MADPGGNGHTSRFSFAPAWVRTSSQKRAGVRGAAAVLGLMGATALTSPSHAQAPPLGTAGSFGVLAGTTVTNTITPTVITGNVGVSPGSAVTGFPPGIVVGGTIHAGDAVALQAQSDNTIAYLNLAGRPVTANLTGQDLGGKTLVAGVYGYTSSAQLTGTLTLDGQGNPNSVFIIKIASGLTTASNSRINLINGAQGGNVFFQVGASATLGTTTSFVGDILALTSITLNTNASIVCGAALARNGQVALDNNTITICQTVAASASSVLPFSATGNQRAVANSIDTFVRNGGALPSAFASLLSFLSPSQLQSAFTQLSGEAGTGPAQAGTQAMNSFLSLVTNPFAENRPFAPDRPVSPIYVKAVPRAAAWNPDPRPWGIWAAAYGGQTNANGDALGVGSHDRSVSNVGFATGLDYRVTPYTVAGFALSGGGTRYGLSEGLGSGRSDMFQAAIYSSTRVDAAYVSAAIAYGFHQFNTDRFVTVAGTDHLAADFAANDIGGRLEGGYRFAIPSMGWQGQSGLTPYAAVQVQSFRTPSYSETALSGASVFALSYNARTITTTRTELGSWLDWSIPVDYGTTLSLRGRAAWAHDEWSSPNITAGFQALPGSIFVVTGAAPATDLALASVGVEIGFRNGFSVGARFDGEFAENSTKYSGMGRLRYTW
ncbi:ice-binding family protein [Afipia sp. GAS231]|uniref:ice-binding family protein n=1 Tax=Afipia sp. GAS231 TaxID=1882747 RepID=UPI00155F6083|nr:ice-binding family protein [Afipia sp. GAS231]